MRLRTVFAFVWREARTLPRHKEALFWLIAFPIFILAMCNWVWIPERHPITISVGVVYEDPGINQYPVNATLVVYALNQTKADNQTLFNVRVLGSREETIDQIRKGQLDAAVVFPEGFSQNMSSGYQACLDVYVSTADPQREPIILGYLSNFLDIYNQRTQAIIIGYITEFYNQTYFNQTYSNQTALTQEEFRRYLLGFARPVNASYTEVAPETLMERKDILGWMVFGMIGVEFLFVGVGEAASFLARERERKTIDRILSSTVTSSELLAGTIGAVFVSLAVSIVVCIGFGVGAIHARIHWSPTNPTHWLAILFLLLGALFCIGLGFLLALIARDERAAWGLTNIVAFPAMFLSGIWLPKWMMPASLRFLADWFPLTVAFDAVRNILVFNYNIAEVAGSIPYLIAANLTVFVIGVITTFRALQRT